MTPAANMKQCILTVATWLLHSDSAPSVTLNLAEQYPPMEAQGPIPDLLRKVLTAYETVSAILPGLSSSWGCSAGLVAPGPPPCPGWGTPNLPHPSLCRGRLRRGLPREESHQGAGLGAHSPSPPAAQILHGTSCWGIL